MRLLLSMLLLTPILARAQGGPTPVKPGSSQTRVEGQQKWHEVEARFKAIGAPGDAALLRERARRKQHLCTSPADMASREAEVRCGTAENQVTEANYLIFKQMIGRMLRLNLEAYPEIPDSVRLPFDEAEEAWSKGRDAICAARVSPRRKAERLDPDQRYFLLGCTRTLTEEHLDELSRLYFLVLEGTY